MSEPRPPRRGDIVIAGFADPVDGEIRKRRPFLVVSPDELNAMRTTYVLVPLTTGSHPYRYRVPCQFAGRKGHIVLDQLVSAAARRVSPPVGRLAPAALGATMARLREMFAE